MGVYDDTAWPGIALQLPEVVALGGDGATVLLYFELSFTKDEDPDSCKGGHNFLAVESAYHVLRQEVELNLVPDNDRKFQISKKTKCSKGFQVFK